MKFKMSNYIAIHTDNVESATQYYEKVFGLKLKDKDKDVNFVDADPFVICVTKGTNKSPAMEYITDDASKAEAWLLENGCKVAEKYPDGKVRYFQDQYGVLFHLWEKKS